jgi:hypothetical protein
MTADRSCITTRTSSGGSRCPAIGSADSCPWEPAYRVWRIRSVAGRAARSFAILFPIPAFCWWDDARPLCSPALRVMLCC